jgi:hypothetical protein
MVSYAPDMGRAIDLHTAVHVESHVTRATAPDDAHHWLDLSRAAFVLSLTGHTQPLSIFGS